MATTTTVPDFSFIDHGSLWLVQANNAVARAHLRANVSEEAQWWASGLAVEPRYVDGLIAGLTDAGFSVVEGVR
jgi:hypothetical protein